MAHYAFINEKNIVTEVILGIDETDESQNWEEFYGAIKNQLCKRTSYNNNIRFNYAGIGYTYDPIDDAFIAPMPTCGHEELTLNELKRWECSNDEHRIQIS